MFATEDPVTEPLLTPADQPQRALLEIVGGAVSATRGWPVYQYVEAKMDDLGLDADAVLSSMPPISHGQLTYSLVRRERSTTAETPVKLSIAGMPTYRHSRRRSRCSCGCSPSFVPGVRQPPTTRPG
jgi:hypothetical protein